jgi:hypothetical protein
LVTAQDASQFYDIGGDLFKQSCGVLALLA